MTPAASPPRAVGMGALVVQLPADNSAFLAISAQLALGLGEPLCRHAFTPWMRTESATENNVSKSATKTQLMALSGTPSSVAGPANVAIFETAGVAGIPRMRSPMQIASDARSARIPGNARVHGNGIGFDSCSCRTARMTDDVKRGDGVTPSPARKRSNSFIVIVPPISGLARPRVRASYSGANLDPWPSVP